VPGLLVEWNRKVCPRLGIGRAAFVKVDAAQGPGATSDSEVAVGTFSSRHLPQEAIVQTVLPFAFKRLMVERSAKPYRAAP
jgi:hypothetical protein